MNLNGTIKKTQALSGRLVKSSGGGSVQEIYWVQYGVGTATNAEVNTAVAANKLPVCYWDSTNAVGQTTRELYYMIRHTPTEAFFANVSSTTGAIWVRRLYADAWYTQMIRYQEALTWDTTPRFGSQNPVTSGGIYQALQNVTIPVDSELSDTSENPVQNKVITEALATKADQASVESTIPPIVNTWLGNNVAQETGYVLDETLTMSNAAAPADKVGDLKSAIENGGYLIKQSDIIQGSYSGTGAVVSNPNRIRPAQFIPVTNGGKVHFVPGENVSAIFYGKFDTNKSFLGDGPSWFSTDFKTDWDGYMICVYRNSANTAITPADYDAVTLVMTASEKEKYEQNKAFASFVSSVNPMNPLLFDLMYFRKGSSTSGTEYLTTYNSPRFINNDFAAFNAASASSGTSGYLAFRFNDTNKPNVLTSGETLSLFLVAKTNKSMTFVPRLSTSTTWAPAYSTAVANDIALSPGYNCIKLEFAFDHSGTDGRTEYRYFVLEGNTVYSDLDAEFSLVRDDSFLGWVKEIAASNSAVYDTDLLFWGDSLTAGAGGTNYSYPKKCSEILGLSRINAGVGGETANTIAARQGGNNIIIPAGAVNGTYALDDLTDIFGYHVNPLRQGNGAGSGNKIIVNGYECTLSISQTSSTSADATYTISGYTGPTLTVPTFARFAGSDFTGKVVVIFVGQNGVSFTGLSGVDARIAIIDSMIKHIGHERYVILGLTSGTDSSREADDNQMLAHYGNKFFPTRKLLVDYGLTINGLTPTAQDTADIAAGTVPSSLRSDGTHMNDYGYIAIGTMLADKICSLGYV